MKTALVTTCFLGDNLDCVLGQESARRYAVTQKFISYYTKHKPEWQIILLDNCSPKHLVHQLEHDNPQVRVISFTEYLGRPSQDAYPYLWRALYFVRYLHLEYDKIIFFDNDFYVLSKKMFQYLDNIQEGWTTFWLPQHNSAETGAQVIIKDCPEYLSYVGNGKYEHRVGFRMEDTLAVTHIAKHLYGNRFGEWNPYPKITPDMDFWSEATLENEFPDILNE